MIRFHVCRACRSFFPSYPITLSGVSDRQADNPLETLRGLQEMIQKPKYRDADDKLIIEP
jgi:hypothetical protein